MNNRTVKMIMTTIAVVCMLLTPQIAQAATDCSNTGTTGIPQTECQSLLDLYNSTNGAGWTNNTDWNVTDTPCSWFGVTCSGGHVIHLSLSGNQLNGAVPDLNLPNLEWLYLHTNQLSGAIPNFSNLPSLTILDLATNQLSGAIPNFTNLPNLTNLYLFTNQLSGTIPSFTNLTNLTQLWLNANRLSGTIPNFNLPNLTQLLLNTNQLSGTIPNLNFSGFTYLYLNNNCGLTAYDAAQASVLTGKDPNWQVLNPTCHTDCNFVTEIPTTECQSLMDLYNSTNGSGWTDKTGWNINNTPCSWFGVTCSSGHVSTLNLNTNQLSGTIPNLNLPSLTSLQLYANQLSGSIPNFNLPNLVALSLYNNQLTGTIPDFNMPNLTTLFLHNNQLSGNIPNFNLPNLINLSLHTNQLSGSIPNFNMPNLISLRLYTNQLSGAIPNFNMPNLTSFSLYNNQLSGTIPNLNFSGVTTLLLNKNCGLTAYDTAQATVLTAKDPIWQQVNPACPATSCNLVTEIPTTECQELLALYNSTNGPGWTDKTGWNINNTPCSWFGVTCSSGHLKTINLQNNQLSGTIPNLALPNLTHLTLMNNQLSGSIPNFNMPSMEVLGLSNNQLTGSIPNFNMPNLRYLTLPNNQLSGSIPNFNMPSLTNLGLYNNQLSGTIPNFNMPNLTNLTLAINQLSGTIPNFNMPNLTSLSLYNNQLSGNIPNFNLPSLTELRLHINHLSGTIPNLNFSGFTALLLNKNCGLTAYDTAQATVLTGKDPIWQQLNPVCPPPAITLSTTSGKAGDSVIITASYFTSLTSPVVTFGTNTATVTNISPPNLTVTVPAGFAAVTVTVTSGGQSASSAFNYVTLPSYTVNFIANPAVGGTVNISSQNVVSGAHTLPVTASPMAGYTFSYWKDQSNAIVSTNATLPAQTITGNTTYTAYFSTASATPYTWTGADTGNPTGWFIAGNWTPTGIPRNPTDNVIIPTVTVNRYPLLQNAVILNKFRVEAGASLTITSPGNFQVNDTADVNGTITLENSGNIQVPPSGVFSINTGGVLKINSGGVQIDAGGAQYRFKNLGTIEWQNGSIDPVYLSGTLPCYFNNEGTILISGTGANLKDCNFTNSGRFILAPDTALAFSNGSFINALTGLIEVPLNSYIHFTVNSTLTNKGTLKGRGTLSGSYFTLVNEGIVDPGWSDASILYFDPLNISGNYTQTSTGKLHIDANVLGSDFIFVTGTTQLGGTVEFVPFGNFTPSGSYDVVKSDGSMSDTLTLTPLTGYMLTKNIVIGTPNIFRISIGRSGYTWSGTGSDNWGEAGNWVEGTVPGAATDSVLIPANCPNYPHINSDVHIGGITIEQGASLTVHTGFSFNIHGDSTNNGTANLLGGNIILAENAVFTNNGALIFFTPEGATSKFADAPASQGKLINNGMIINQSFAGVLDVFNFEQIPTDSAKGILIQSGDLRFASGNTQNTYTIGASAFSGDGTLIFGSDNPDTYPMMIVRDNLDIGVRLRWVSGVIEPESGVTTQLTMTLSKNADIGSAVFKKLYGMDLSIASGSIITLKDGEFYLGNKANFKVDGGILSVEGKISFYNYDPDAALTGTVVNNGTVRGTGILSFAPDAGDPKSQVVFSNNRILSPGLLTFDMGSSVYDHSSGTLNIEISNTTAGSGYDRLHVIGNVKLGGTLNVVADSAYVPHDGDVFDILTLINTGSLTGQFASVNLPNISGFHWEPVSYASPVRLTLRQNTSAMLTVAVDPAGSGAVSGGGITCPAVCDKTVDSTVASSITLSASANSGYVFDRWELNNAAAGTDPASLTVNFPANSLLTQAVKAVFRQIRKNRITLSVFPSGGGWVSGSGFSCGGCSSGTTCADVCQQDFDPAVTPSITLSASANTGYEFDYWKVNDVMQTPSSSSQTISTSSPTTVIAVFRQKSTLTRTLSVSVSPGVAGKVSVYPSGAESSECPGNCSVTAASGTKVSLYAMPNSGYHFIGWSGSIGGSFVSAEVTMDSNKSVIASFEADIPYQQDYCPNDPNKTEPGICGCGKPETENCIEDTCPDDPLKTEPGICGCGVADTDTDRDGVADCLDKCPLDPTKTEPGKCGCGKPETENCGGCPAGSLKTEPGICGCDTADTDSDGDGVADCFDRCKSDPKKAEPGICGCGVPDIDSKGDGITDCLRGDPPKPPILLSPKLQEIIAHAPVKLTASPFSAPGNQAHIATHWLIQRADMLYRSPKKALFEDHTVTSGNMTEFEFSDLSPGLKYICKAGYRSSGNTQIAWSDESSFIVGTPEQSPILEIPAGETAEQYRMFSFPYWLQNEDAVAALSAVIGSYDPKMIRIGAYDANTGGYVEYGEGMKIIPGKAYWILSRNGVKLTITGVPVSLNHVVEVILDNGWNMIAAPNNADYDWSKTELIVYDDDLKIIYGPAPLSAADSQKYVDVLWQWQNGDYTPATSLEKNKGYWLKSKQSGVVLRFPETARGKSAVRARRSAENAEKPPMPMGNTGFSINSDTGDAAGGCFINSAAQK